MGDVAMTIDNKLRRAFAPTRLVIEDQSSTPSRPCRLSRRRRSHFRVEIVSDAFEGKSRVARQRLIYAALKDEFAAGLHALALTTLTPARRRKPRVFPSLDRGEVQNQPVESRFPCPASPRPRTLRHRGRCSSRGAQRLTTGPSEAQAWQLSMT